MPTYSVMTAVFPGFGLTRQEPCDWLTRTVCKMKADPRIGKIKSFTRSSTPITMVRNLCVKMAQEEKVDYLLMIDNDMEPDIADTGSRPFWDSSFEFLLNHRDTPSVVAAPYCGPSPINNIYAFHWRNWSSKPFDIHPSFTLEQYQREEAAIMTGITRVAALATGVILIDMRVFERLKHPYFYYEFSDKTQSSLASTEDVTFSRDLSIIGVPMYVNFDAWAYHWKWEQVGKPKVMTVDAVNEKLREAILLGRKSDEKLIMVGDEYDAEDFFPGVPMQAPETSVTTVDCNNPNLAAYNAPQAAV